MSIVPIVLERTDGHALALRSALLAEGLPIDDLTEDGRTLFRVMREGGMIGFGGYEMLGEHALIRSLVILPEHRGAGLGAMATDLLLDRARRDGARHAFLLTDTAAAFFERLGFTSIDRSMAPEVILKTRQAESLCPSSATLLVRDLQE